MSEQSSSKKKSESDGRLRTWAFIFYPDPVFDIDLLDRLTQLHLVGCISPLHDRDTLPTGEIKKAHYHVFLQFDGKKSFDQVKRVSWAVGVKLDEESWALNIAPYVLTLDVPDDSLFSSLYLADSNKKAWPSCSTIPIGQNSTRGACRYWCHLDSPDKAQYSPDDVREFGGFDWHAAIEAESDFEKMAIEIERFIDDNRIIYYSALVRYCRDHRPEWHRALRKGLTLHISAYLKSHDYELRRHGDNVVSAGVTSPDPDPRQGSGSPSLPIEAEFEIKE